MIISFLRLRQDIVLAKSAVESSLGSSSNCGVVIDHASIAFDHIRITASTIRYVSERRRVFPWNWNSIVMN